ncbi:casein kinase I, partial [Tulasnella sp. 418]
MSFSTSEGPMAKPLKVGSHFSVRRKIGVGDAGFQTEHSGTIFIIDFMHATPWCNLKTKRHIPYRTEISNALAARYASINTHLGYEQSRRDDLESLGYMLLYLARGWLPWQGVMGADIPEQHLKVLRIKQEVSIADICEGLPDEFSIYLQCVRNLAFTETPDYDFLRSLFTNALRRMGYVEDGVYDWMRPQYGTRQKASDVRVFYVDNDIEYLESPTLNSNRKGRHPQPSTLQDNPLATRSMQALGPESLRPTYSRVTQKTKTDPLSAQSKELDSSVTTPPDRVELSLFIPWSKEFSGKYRQRTTSAYAYGGFSNVWICDAEKHDSTLHAVAMKELRPVNMPRTVADSEAILKQMLKRAEREFTIWAQLEHPNVAPLIGFRLQPVMRLFSPWYSNGNIKQWVISHPEVNFRKMMEQVARGLVYLHSLTPPIAHGDIKS